MISVDIKPKSSSPIESILAVKDTKETLSFSELLKGVTVEKEGNKIVQNGLLVLALNETAKDLNTLTQIKIPLNTIEDVKIIAQEIQALALNPQITKNLSVNDVKLLIKDAKNYLKNQIIQSAGFKKSEITALPKTLKGLVQVAKKFGIDISKISIEKISTKPISTLKIDLPKQAIAQKNSTQEVAVPKDSQLNTKVTQNVRKQEDVKKIDTSNIRLEENVLETTKKESTSKENIVKELSVRESDTKVKTPKTPNTAKVQKTEIIVQESSKELIINETYKIKVPAQMQKEPLFQAQASKEITTQEILNTKIQTLNLSPPKQKANETLKTLLQGKKITAKENVSTSANLTADFSVEIAKVIAPRLTNSDVKQSLETLLYATPKEEKEVVSKTDGISVNKADSFEVKLNEAKQMIKYISQDVKSAIEDYKAPFTRIKLQLNPQRLGEVDLTIVQRGKNLHINLSSNNVAINTLALNANDLKVQLNNSGINNATLNFNNNSQGSDAQAQNQQQQHHNQREAKEEYNYFDTQDKNEEIQSSLEIVVPHYA